MIRSTRALLSVLLIVTVSSIALAEEETGTAAAATDQTAASDESAAEGPLSGDFSLGIFSDYMWRGLRLYNGPSIQPTLNLNYELAENQSLTGTVWSHAPGERGKADQRFVEFDYTLAYNYTVDLLTLTAGNVWYTYAYDKTGLNNETTGEVFLTASLDLPIVTTLSFFQDWNVYTSQYYELALSKEIPVAMCDEELSVEPYASIGFASNAEGYYANNGLEQVTFGANFPIDLGGDFTLAPSMNYTWGIDENTHTEFWGGGTVGYSF